MSFADDEENPRSRAAAPWLAYDVHPPDDPARRASTGTGTRFPPLPPPGLLIADSGCRRSVLVAVVAAMKFLHPFAAVAYLCPGFPWPQSHTLLPAANELATAAPTDGFGTFLLARVEAPAPFAPRLVFDCFLDSFPARLADPPEEGDDDEDANEDEDEDDTVEEEEEEEADDKEEAAGDLDDAVPWPKNDRMSFLTPSTFTRLGPASTFTGLAPADFLLKMEAKEAVSCLRTLSNFPLLPPALALRSEGPPAFRFTPSDFAAAASPPSFSSPLS